MKIVYAIVLGLFLVGCEERYRYPCQNPYNWNEEYCKRPYCSSNGTCPEDLAHYLKDGEKGGKQPQSYTPQENKGSCK